LEKRNLSILGSTGSIGTQALDIADFYQDYFNIVALSANSNWELLAEQANKFQPKYLLLGNGKYIEAFENMLTYQPAELLHGNNHLETMASLPEADTILNSLVGFAGFKPTVSALKSGKRVALANKESLVVGGEIIRNLTSENPDQLIPVDSEHSAMLQCLVGESAERIEKIIITASGGPFREWPKDQMSEITVEDALSHPNWEMGNKITIDSSTLMNKGLEIIEAYWLYDIPFEKIEPVIHPQSIIHSVIEFVDGSSKAQLGPPDMKVPIIYSLTYPDRLPLDTPRINWNQKFDLNFEPVDYERFPCLKLAIEAGKSGGHAPAVLNAANEVAVDRFLKKEIKYIDIAKIVEKCLSKINRNTDLTSQSLYEVDRETRDLAEIL
jgi:1-deoxy-D-xylulose-5-phosphate reductoisomerase